jgi:hypothetical protein
MLASSELREDSVFHCIIFSPSFFIAKINEYIPIFHSPSVHMLENQTILFPKSERNSTGIKFKYGEQEGS